MKLNVRQVLSESASFYKENFKNLMGISFMVFIFTASVQVMGHMQTMLKGYLLWLLLFILVMLAVEILVIIFFPRLFLSMLVLINSLLDKNKMTMKEAYRQTKGKYWLMVGCSALIALCYIPGIVLVLYTKIPFAALINSIYIAFITSLYYTVLPMIAIEPRTGRYLRRSIQMIKGNYISVLILTLITTTILAAINGVMTYIFQGKPTGLLVIGAIYKIVYFFVYPFSSTVTVIAYRYLKGSQKQDIVS